MVEWQTEPSQPLKTNEATVKVRAESGIKLLLLLTMIPSSATIAATIAITTATRAATTTMMTAATSGITISSVAAAEVLLA